MLSSKDGYLVLRRKTFTVFLRIRKAETVKLNIFDKLVPISVFLSSVPAFAPNFNVSQLCSWNQISQFWARHVFHVQSNNSAVMRLNFSPKIRTQTDLKCEDKSTSMFWWGPGMSETHRCLFLGSPLDFTPLWSRPLSCLWFMQRLALPSFFSTGWISISPFVTPYANTKQNK